MAGRAKRDISTRAATDSVSIDPLSAADCGQPVPDGQPQDSVEWVACAHLPTRFGEFNIVGFLDRTNGKEHTVMVKGDVTGREDCPVRVHSECHTGDVWTSLRCDCREQLEKSLEYVQAREFGAVIYLRQEGRGIGLFNKLRAYNLQDQGLDTVEANTSLGLPSDAREYLAAADIIRLLQIRSVALLTNNPDKIEGLRREGITVTRRVPMIVPANSHNRRYLKTKRERLGHFLD
jgi:GTP cyclohydrolase II